MRPLQRFGVLATARSYLGAEHPWAEYQEAQALGPDPYGESLVLSGWWRAPFVGSPWVGEPSEGPSESRDLTEATNPPAPGTAQNGYVPADFDGTNDVLSYVGAADIVGAGTGWAFTSVVQFDALAAPSGAAINDPCLFAIGPFTAAVALSVNSDGLALVQYSGAPVETARIPVVTGQYYVVQARWDGAEIWLRVDAGTPETAGPIAGMDDPTPETLIVGSNYDQTPFLSARVLELQFRTGIVSTAELDDAYDYAVTRYGLASGAANVVLGPLAVSPTWPGATVSYRSAVVLGPLAPAPSWPSPTLGSRTPVAMGPLAPTPSWPSPTVLGRVVVAFGPLTVTPTWPAPTLTARGTVVLGPLAPTPSWPSPTLGSRAALAIGPLAVAPAWYAPSLAGSSDVELGPLTATPTWYAPTLAVPVVPVVVARAHSVGELVTVASSAGQVRTDARSVGEARTTAESAGETRTAARSRGEVRTA